MKTYYCQYFKVVIIYNIEFKKKTWLLDFQNSQNPVQIVLTKKNFKKANTRNLLKRRFLNSILSLRSEFLNLKREVFIQNCNIVKFYLNKEAKNISFAMLTEELKKYLNSL